MDMSDRPTSRTRRDILRTGAFGAGAATLAAYSTALPASATKVRHWDDEADVVIMGSGAAGISAAIEASSRGAAVRVYEMLALAGGSSSLSGGVCYMGGGTPLQKALGFEDSTEDMYRFMAAASGVHAPLTKIQLYCEQSLAHFDWLVANGVQYAQRFSAEKELSHEEASLYFCGNERTHPYRELARPAPRGHVPPAKNQTGGRSLMQTLLASAQRHGVHVATDVTGERLACASDGTVLGLEVRDARGTRSIRARKGVVLAAGGFIHNPEMLKKHAPELFPCAPHWGRAGDLGIGIRMGMEVGANVLHMHHGFAVLPLYPPENVLKGVVVNARGQRCVAEDSYYGVLGHDILFNQGGHGYLVVDRTSDYSAPDYRLVVAGEAQTIAALEAQLGLPTESLQQTVAYYNRFAERGEDPLLGKARAYLAPVTRQPFKAYDLGVDKAFYSVHTFGGLETTVNAEVVNAGGEIIPGLYAAGRTAAGIPVSPYYASGLSIGDATFFGRRAAMHAVARRT
jgi:succinate dehydrogenase/fumarate reductase flavoprotein subunit